MKRTVFLGLLFSLFIVFSACGDNGDGDVTVDIPPGGSETPPPVAPPPSGSPIATPTAAPTATPSPTPTTSPEDTAKIEANLDILVAATIAAEATDEEKATKRAEIQTAADTYKVDLANPTLSAKLVRFVVKIKPEAAALAEEIKAANKNNQIFITDTMTKVKDYKTHVAFVLSMLLPDIVFEVPTDDGKFGGGIAQSGAGIFGVIFDAIIEAMEQIGIGISYQVNGECKGFFQFGEPNQSKEGSVTYVSCENIFKDPPTFSVGNDTTKPVSNDRIGSVTDTVIKPKPVIIKNYMH
ncbi:MAG: hypothetical protein HYU97_00295 [Deltaproteobacteria bacterium]|nr:hypothetical protein [Deltaproteobacteria bacterium]